MYLFLLSAVLITFTVSVSTFEKLNLETLNNYSEFLNFGVKKSSKLDKNQRENSIIKSKIDVLGEIFKSNIDQLKSWGKLDVIFLIDSSSSVGEQNFRSEIKFVKKLLSDVTVDYDHARVAVVTFSSANNVIKNIDEISEPKKENNKCLLFTKQLNKVNYTGGGTYTLGAFKTAQEIFERSRNDSKKILFLITDGFSNGGDPIPLANDLKKKQITIFTIGIQTGNYHELYKISSPPGEYYSYLLSSFQEFESLARRALHVDLKSGDYIPLGINTPCDSLCESGDCCDRNALCTCGTSTGHYSCICQPGYYGSGLRDSCSPCPAGTYSNGPNLCLPCPDLHHTTKPPANGISSCKCKSGFRSTNDDNHRCEILKCPKISSPDHGYLVKKRDCGNVLNSACGIRCEVGYTLTGSSIRLCQSNATWSGDEPSCQIKTCPKVFAPPYGTIKCSQIDLDVVYNDTNQNLPVDTVCTFDCENGKTLIGSSQRTCLPLARWDGLKTSCKQIKCPKLSPVNNGRIEPQSCTFGKQPYGTICKIICNDGFKLDGPSEKTCTGNHGLWDSKFESTSCKDVTPPMLTCPDNITASTQLGKKFGLTSWSRPQVIDNSDLEVSVWMKPSIKNISSFRFQIGLTEVTYFAQDSYQNRAKCSFFVNIIDDERPIIENCLDPPTYLTNEQNGANNITWDEPNIFDNSQKVQIKKSHEFGFFPMGTTSITYDAVDSSGNRNVCIMNITIEDAHCEALPDPIYGHSECAPDNDGMQCVITCQEGYAVPLAQPQSTSKDDNSSINFMCSDSESVWYNQDGLMFPECSVTEIPKQIEQTGTISIDADGEECNNPNKLADLENDVKINLKLSCGENCNVKTNTTCLEVGDETVEEETNKIKKRETSYEEAPHRNSNRRRSKKKKINVKFQVKGKYVDAAQNDYANRLKFEEGRNVSLQYHHTKFICPSGFVPRKKRCVQCPKGTFHNTSTNKCQSCPFGFFNDNLGENQCVPCPPYHSTRRLHSKKIEDCREQCSPGTHARKKLIKQSRKYPNLTIERATLKPYCKSCPIGYFQPQYGEIRCLPCPKGHTTLTVGAISISQCIPTSEEICFISPNICNTGTCTTTNDFEYSCNCPEGFIGSHCEKRVSACDSNPCVNGGFCRSIQSSDFQCVCPRNYKGKYCEIYEEKCLLECFNGGTCQQNDPNDYFCSCPSGFGGDSCEFNLKYCFEGICENNSSCIEEINTFRCECTDGFIGRRCNILPCDYKPCKRNQICINTMKKHSDRNSFKCICPDGYQGEFCDQKINFCIDNPCLNKGVCVNNESTFTCDCPKPFYGRYCEDKKRSDYILNFQKFSTTDYVKLNGFRKNLSEITACLWMQTQDSINYGTLISYATKKFDNAFTLTDYTGLVFYVNNKYAVTDVLLNDGLWHHVCISWENSKGTYKVYLDGKVVKNGSDLSMKSEIEGNGNMVIGQEQDILGGRFSQSETFIGKMAYIDIWSRELTQDEIKYHMNDCQEKISGDIYSWPEIRENVKGNVEITNSSFCMKCNEPKPMYNGVINVIDNVASYECYKGFELSSTIYNQGRKCNKARIWEGTYEPYCKRIYCGYPGFVRNSYIIGNQYYLHDKITYQCYEGYKLKGNSTIICTENGNWSPEKPQCLGSQCTAFKKPENSNLTIIAEYSYEEFIEHQTVFDIGTQIEINCPQNANLSGETLLTCLENGTWDFQPPECLFEKPKTTDSNCDLNKIPEAPLNGYIDEDSQQSVKNGTNNIIEYKCRNGYNLIGDNFTTCIVDGYWTHPNISCSPVLCTQPKFKNMKASQELSKRTHEFGNMLKYDCTDGYEMFGDGVIRCLANGKWSRMRAKCARKSCRKPPVKDSTKIQGDSYLFEDVVTITCSNKAQYTLTCNSYGTWIGDKDDTC